MLKVSVEKGCVHTEFEGSGVVLLSELTMGTARVLHKLLGDLPSSLKDELLKMFFETTLETLSDMEGEEQ